MPFPCDSNILENNFVQNMKASFQKVFCFFVKERIFGTKALFVRSVKTRNTPAGNTNRLVYEKEL